MSWQYRITKPHSFDWNDWRDLEAGAASWPAGEYVEFREVQDEDAAMPARSRPDVPHYQHGAIEPIDYIMAHNMDFSTGNVIKYATRWQRKGGIADLRKIKTYVDFLIEDAERNPAKYGLTGPGKPA